MRLSDIEIREFAEWKTAADFGGERRSLPDAGCFSFIRFQGEDLSREDLNRENLNRNGQDGRI